MGLHGLLVIDKPRGWTSHDVVARIRRLLKTKKVGHAGTLDPAAEGVLVIAVGRATKLLHDLSGSSKRYAAHVVLGVNSDSGDIEGPACPVDVKDPAPSIDDVRTALARLTGDVQQIPPAHSAIKVDGQPLYRRARRGKAVEAPPRHVRIDSIDILDFRGPDLFIDVRCSSGTYIRSVARDIGNILETGAYLHYLLRTESGSFTLAAAWTMDQIERALAPETFSWFARHPALESDESKVLLLADHDVSAWYDGRPVPGPTPESDQSPVHAFRHDGAWLGVGVYDGGRGAYQPKFVVHE